MKKYLWLIGLLGVTGLSMLTISKSAVYAEKEAASSILSDEDIISSVACSAKEMAHTLINNALEEKEQENEEAVQNLTVSATDTSDDEEEAKEEEDETVNVKELISNLNYDRLGIANVDNWLNIRKKPGEDQKIIGKLPKNAGCHIYYIKKNGWAKIKSGNVTGFVDSQYLLTDEEAEEYALTVANKVATVQTETLNARFLPATDSAKVTLIPQGEDLDVVRENLTKKYVESYVEKHFTGEYKQYLKDVDLDAIYDNLDDWILVKIDDERAFVAKEYIEISYQLKKAVSVTEVKENKSTGVTSVRASMVEFAKQYLGNKYVWGGTSLTNGTDCSGFVMRIYQNFGYSIPRTSAAQASYCTSISSSELKPGDLLFYGSGSSVSHVAMYIGSGLVIHASNAKDGIKISNAFYRTPIKIGRVIND